MVLSSDDLNLTSSEIAKAFQILRKYRYTFSAPDSKLAFGHNEAESSTMQSSNRKSLPYLDLADSYMCKMGQRDHPDRPATPARSRELADQVTQGCEDSVMAEIDIDDYLHDCKLDPVVSCRSSYCTFVYARVRIRLYIHVGGYNP